MGDVDYASVACVFELVDICGFIRTGSRLVCPSSFFESKIPTRAFGKSIVWLPVLVRG